MATTSEAVPVRPTRPPRSFRSGALTTLLVLPASLWYLILLVLPLAIVVVMSFGLQGKFGGYAPGFTLDNYGAPSSA